MDERERAEDLVLDWLHAFNPYLTLEARSSLVDRIVRLESAERERCAKIAENEMVDAQSTGSEADYVYNAAIQDVVNAIRARGEQ